MDLWDKVDKIFDAVDEVFDGLSPSSFSKSSMSDGNLSVETLDGNIVITGDVKSLKINGKTINLKEVK